MTARPATDDIAPVASDAELLPALRLIAERAGEVVLAFYGEETDMGVREKVDASPVTAADEACEAYILEALARLTPDIPVISEEAAEGGQLPDLGDGQRFWLVDPLDGTKEFISRNGEFTVNIALIDHGRPVAGVVHAPAKDRTWAAADGRATYSESKAPPREIAVRDLPQTGATVVASRRHGAGEDLDRFLAGYQVNELVSAGSSIKFCLVALGSADVYPRFGRTMEWDTAAGQAVLESAGGRVETVEGVPLRYNKPGFENPFFIAYGGHQTGS